MRQIDADAAIESLTEYGNGRAVYISVEEAVRRIEQLPSAQPEIIRCKDCRYHWTYKCMDGMPTERCELEQTFYDANIDYCSLAVRRGVT